ncbi:hypothetical protein ARMGADRAFT_1076171 [Armillaria gallica]|uniref:Uncharacterized protein n=1 Tax=Armillaria gallica TaxID=47427 RepID=A0A2H3DR78_ARMGA|nr:hypothetical protein ARMGADRAFT_1076171 [Armillaria gallica]
MPRPPESSNIPVPSTGSAGIVNVPTLARDSRVGSQLPSSNPAPENHSLAPFTTIHTDVATPLGNATNSETVPPTSLMNAASTGQRSSPPPGANQHNASAGTPGFNGRKFMRWIHVIASSLICAGKVLSCCDNFDLDSYNDD